MSILKEQDAPIRVAVVDYDKCFPDKCGWACKKACPVNRKGVECIVEREDIHQPRIIEETCIGCLICEKVCPFDAISIVNLTPKVGKPVHQYAENAFRLYGLPTPAPGAIVGLIGRNGIGKSTALSILAGKTPPNLGDFASKGSWKEAIERYKGQELQAHFERVQEGETKVSLKVQNINQLSHMKGTVHALLKKLDERKKLSEVVQQFELGDILERTLSQVSGGELQRIAIAGALLKDADLYYFDEPSTYLDVRQRLRVAANISKLPEEEKSGVLVEHDLALLDYLSDYIHVFFGDKSVYGVASERRSVLNGVNEYLAGYLKTENLRFRDHEIKFEKIAVERVGQPSALFTYPALEKKLGDFSLKIEGGTLHAGEVIGVLGPNATGKTTLVKMLAGVLKPDKEKLEHTLSVSYKPQYLEPEKGKTARQLFDENEVDFELFSRQLDKYLYVSEFLDRNMEELSGGELQKVALSLAMCREADLVLLDEPSAFIDIEDRLATAKAIRSIVQLKERAALVVEHDILFQDYISDRLVVFSGEPGLRGQAGTPTTLEQGMNAFLKEMGVTFRRDPQTGRPRANKLGSVKDKEQKKSGKYYYV